MDRGCVSGVAIQGSSGLVAIRTWRKMERLPTNRELQALKILWKEKRCTVRSVFESLSASEQDNELAYTTVLSLMQTMERKGLVKRESEGRGKTHYYQAAVASESTMRSLAQDFLDSVFDGAMGQYLVSALEARSPSKKELDELSEMISDAQQRIDSA